MTSPNSGAVIRMTSPKSGPDTRLRMTSLNSGPATDDESELRDGYPDTDDEHELRDGYPYTDGAPNSVFITSASSRREVVSKDKLLNSECDNVNIMIDN